MNAKQWYQRRVHGELNSTQLHHFTLVNYFSAVVSIPGTQSKRFHGGDDENLSEISGFSTVDLIVSESEMALGKKCGSLKSKHGAVIAEDEKLVLGLGYYTRGFGRKRIAASKNDGALALDSISRTPLKRRCSKRRTSLDSGIEHRNGSDDSSPLESLPQDVLIRIVCGVDHDDLEQLVHVSKAIREAAWVAKQCHFAYSTPTKNRSNFRTSIDFDDIEAPNAPRQLRACRSRVSGKSLADISVALFAEM